ncbi:TonB-dependent receptor [Tenacibaculum ovolyticum]|uniref:TonB-dependent receptor n=1 Tax=Tenacibaculum ovolyticum TaxID=104270 RepID=UPI001F31567A|nr:TonB-dependent receptor [Tenacibaculum ovolyticum]
MKIDKIFFAIFFTISFNLLAQEKTDKISINIDNLNKEQIINLIESKTTYNFFYLKKWLDKKVITKDFKNLKISSILDHILDNSDLNFFIDKDKIILTKGNLIHKSVYQKKDSNSLQKNNLNHLSKTPIIDNNNFFKIGKDNNNNNNTYILSGYIKNKKTGKPIEGINVFERSKNKSTTTNKEGFYLLKLTYGKNYIETSFTGFRNHAKNIILYGNGNLNFQVYEESEKLDEVIINANKFSNKLKESIIGITQIKAKDIKTIPQVLGERDILKAATTLPGIKSAGEGAEGVNVRGGKVDQNLFLLDGGVIYNPTHFLGLFSAINPFTTNDLKIYKGNIPAEYGGRISSVFDLKTKDANTKKIKGEASIGPVTGNISLEVPIIKEKAGLMIGIRSTYSNWLLNALDNKRFKNSSANFYDLITKYNHKINESNSIKLTGYYSKDKYQIASDSINSYGNTIASLNWKHQFNDKNIGNLILSNSSYTFNIDYKNNSNGDFNLKYKINEMNMKLKMKYLHSKKHIFIYGLESKLYNISPGTIKPGNENSSITPLSINKERALENGIFLSDKYNINKKLTISLGLRFSQYLALGDSKQRIYRENSPKNESTLTNTLQYDKNEIYKTYQGLSYRLSTSYLVTPSLSIKAGINKSFQYIHRLNNNTSASPIDTWRLSNINIKPQEGIQVSFGVFKNLITSNYEISLESYYKEYKNILDYKTGANLLLNETIETDVLQGPGKSYGIEFLIKKKIGRLNGWLGYSYSKSLLKLASEFNEEKINNGNYFATNYDKPHDLNLILNYKLTKRFSLSSNFNYQTGRPVTYPNGKYSYQGIEFLTYSNRNEFRIPDYYRLDIGLNIEGSHKIKKIAHSFWNISIYNVLGRNNPYSVFFRTEAGNINAYRSSIFSFPVPTITYNLKF